jgi:hypothetical protein
MDFVYSQSFHMMDNSNSNPCNVFYISGNMRTVYRFRSDEEKNEWETAVMALKNDMAGINKTYQHFNHDKTNACLMWVMKYNAFVEEWTKERTPEDIVNTRNSVAAAIQDAFVEEGNNLE